MSTHFDGKVHGHLPSVLPAFDVHEPSTYTKSTFSFSNDSRRASLCSIRVCGSKDFPELIETLRKRSRTFSTNICEYGTLKNARIEMNAQWAIINRTYHSVSVVSDRTSS